MRVTEISVTKLFGIFDHTIPLNMDEHITIIHGPNGFGKTVILRMLYGLFKGRYSEILRIPFEKFQVGFDDNSYMWIDRANMDTQDSILFPDQNTTGISPSEDDQSPVLRINLAKTKVAEPSSFLLASLDDIHDIRVSASRIDREIPELHRVGTDEWIHLVTGETLNIDDVAERYSYLLFDQFDIPDWWLDIQKSINIYLIGIDRLQVRASIGRLSSYVRQATVLVPTVKEYAEELRKLIQKELAGSVNISQSLDRTFLTRLSERMGAKDRSGLTDNALRSKLSDLEKKRRRFIEAGLLDEEHDIHLPSEKEISNIAPDVLAVYIQDAQDKLGILDEITNKIELFKRLINKRFLYKEIDISKKDGIRIITLQDEPLQLSLLSSGEQHELVLLYEMLFKTDPGSLILIDEPEMSLHVEWQHEFLRDLVDITKLASLDVLIATHSPQIIHDRWDDLTVRLKRP